MRILHGEVSGSGWKFFAALLLLLAAVYCIETGCDAIERGANVGDRIRAAIGGPLLLLGMLGCLLAGPLGQCFARY